ncbi:hypothetical protein BCR36DRAFT_415662 [Piromyces finnis]|uniref:RING-type domain-containing protein n=1 Tax=Piromyces finnis TaxID=1754191 RepID=A0A1Y1UY04_9FUNG|nr:hypothetical protein BCR36DRAFT_415662 [Piromyces finnis]|eukprot:ORX43250.1 hypothetical protein BCR36DRAFT_415662 [Piromyces finnis]
MDNLDSNTNSSNSNNNHHHSHSYSHNSNNDKVISNEKPYTISESLKENKKDYPFDEEIDCPINEKKKRPLFSGLTSNLNHSSIGSSNNKNKDMNDDDDNDNKDKDKNIKNTNPYTGTITNNEIKINIYNENQNINHNSTFNDQMKKSNTPYVGQKNRNDHDHHDHLHPLNYLCSSSYCGDSDENKILEPDKSECDIIHGTLASADSNFCSTETIVVDQGTPSSSHSIYDDIYNDYIKKKKIQMEDTTTTTTTTNTTTTTTTTLNKNDIHHPSNILFINDTYSVHDDTNYNNNYCFQNEIMTTISTSSNETNNFNDLTREELEPTHTAWNTWRLWCIIKFLFSLLILLFGIRSFSIDYKVDCFKNYKLFSMFYICISIAQLILNGLLIIYLPHKIYQINYRMHRRLFIAKILWGFQSLIDTVQLIMLPIGINILKDPQNTCDVDHSIIKSSSYNFIFYVTLITTCTYILMVIILLITPCWTLFMLLPKYEGVSMSQFKKINTIEVTKDVIEQDSFCVICMESFKLKTKVKQLPCKHIYHKNCISIWFAEHNKCPTCRYEID